MTEFICKYLAIPWRRDGRGFDGADCWGLVCLWFRHELGIEFAGFKDTPQEPGMFDKGKSVFADNAWRYVVPISRQEAARHDIVLIRNKSPVVNHIGVLVAPERFLHVMENHTATVSRLSSWQQSIAGIYRHKDLTT